MKKGKSLIQEILSEGMGYSESLNYFRRWLIKEALRESSGNRSETARRLKMHRSNLVALIKRLGIDPDSDAET